tara:strand:+ start:238 stop:900 length:663 start_codon:yes stop_codon:yes gene_type:complete
MADTTKFPGDVEFEGTIDTSGGFTVTNTNDAAATNVAALVCSGGVGVVKKIHVGTGIELDAGSLAALNLKHQYTLSGSTGVVNLSGSGIHTASANHVYVVGKSDGTAIALPTPSHVGEKVKFIVKPASSNHTITTQHSTALYEGYAFIQAASTAAGPSGSALPAVFHPDMSNDRVITFGADQSKGGTGTIVCTATSTGQAGKWMVEAELFGSGTLTTPFS